MSNKLQFSTNEYVVYPAHGVGQIVSVEEQEIAGASLELYVIVFEIVALLAKDKNLASLIYKNKIF